jgi:CxxC-x17-CxxC domain-containing protein
MRKQNTYGNKSGRRDRNDRGGNARGGSRNDKPTWQQANGPSGVSHTTDCHMCKKECTVPFKPNGSKPVLCRKCFKKSGGTVSKKPRQFNGQAPSQTPGAMTMGMKKELAAINKKLDNIIGMLSAGQVEYADDHLWFEDEKKEEATEHID